MPTTSQEEDESSSVAATPPPPFPPPPSRPPPVLKLDQLRHIAQHGFAHVQLPAHLAQELDRLFARSASFFDLPGGIGTKERLFPSAVAGDTEHGYSFLPDEKEYLTVRYAQQSVVPDDAASTVEGEKSGGGGGDEDEGRQVATELGSLIDEAWHDMANFLYRVLVDISESLGYISPTAWDPLVAGSLDLPGDRDHATPTLLRIFRYFPERGVADMHRDLGLLTLCVCRERGLQVWERPVPDPAVAVSASQQQQEISSEQQAGGDDGRNSTETPGTNEKEEEKSARPTGEWKDAGDVTILVGDTLRVLSGNKIPAGMHRVVATKQGRSSIVFALRASTSATIDLCQFGGSGTVESQALWDRIRRNRVNVNAQKEIRQEQLLAKNRRAGEEKGIA